MVHNATHVTVHILAEMLGFYCMLSVQFIDIVVHAIGPQCSTMRHT